ncbi:ribosome maturation factor RimP [Catalinimonas alkaloidigena]|uniref:Ribosome maturation factor RimP n=2 Tax=Catalinimonas alkaloidigena TaxID=1075417 RepID=A0A1G9DF18_9BACT|nr:ribosome maturation factor RimP [Catalinimonas alkaloidigena]
MVQEHLAGSSLFPVAVEVKGSAQRPKVVVLLDGDSGVKIDDCAKVSRWLGERLEELNLFGNAYTLEVSSPGVDFPLTQPRQYPQHIGRTLNVTLTEGETVTGRLESVNHDGIVVLETRKEKGKKATTQPRDLLFSQINQAQVQVSFK